MKKIILLIITDFFLATNIIYTHPGIIDEYGFYIFKTNCSKG